MSSSIGTKGTASSRRKSSTWSNLKNTSFGESRSYLFEYGLLLLLTGGLVYIVIAMVESFFEKVVVSLPAVFFRDSDVFLLSAITVVLPLVIILIQRTAESERANPAIKNLGWRKAFLGIFVAIISIWAVLSSILFINSVLEYLSNGILSGESFDWQQSLKYLVSSLVLIVTAWTFGNDYRYVTKDHFAGLRHGYRYGLVIVSLVIGLLFLIFPFRDNRTTYADEQITNDLYSISSLVDSYNSSASKLPVSLNDLSLTKDQLERSTRYAYSYEAASDTSYQLCASFNKGGTDPNASSFSSGVPDIAIHTAGNNCFTFTVNSAATPVSDTMESVTPTTSDSSTSDQLY